MTACSASRSGRHGNREARVTCLRRNRGIADRYQAREVPTDHVPTRRAAAKEKFAWLLDSAAVSS
jgi:hypothetical protein